MLIRAGGKSGEDTGSNIGAGGGGVVDMATGGTVDMMTAGGGGVLIAAKELDMKGVKREQEMYCR